VVINSLVSLLAILAVQLVPGIVAQRLLDPQLPVRVTAANQLKSEVAQKPEILQDAAIQDRIIAALEFENEVTRQNLERVMKGQTPLFDEEYGEHYAQVLGLADQLRRGSKLPGPQRTRLLRALVLGTYNGDSQFAVDLAQEGETISALVLQAVKSANDPTRWNGFDLIGLLFTHDRASRLTVPLSNQTREAFRLAARDGLQDQKPDVRRHAVQAVVQANDTGAIPLLRYMAEKDADAKGKWSVRALAAEAVTRLQQSR
jgi:HEAT repeat protein